MNKDLHDSAVHHNDIKRNDFINKLRSSNTEEATFAAKEEYMRFFEGNSIDTVSNIAYQLRMMDKYIMPPHLDFTRNRAINPYVAYIFQFKSRLSRNDLQDIWQNIYPQKRGPFDYSKNMTPFMASVPNKSRVTSDVETSDVEYITHTLKKESIPNFKDDPSMYDSAKFLKEKVRWLVFKIKYRGESNYDKLRRESAAGYLEDVRSFNSPDPQNLNFPGRNLTVGPPPVNVFDNYSYNWPYDYFSLVESIKIESKVDFYSEPPEEEFQLVSSAYTAAEQDRQQRVFQIVENNTGTTTTTTASTSADSEDVLVVRQELKQDNSTPPSPANTLTIAVESGYALKSGSESIYVNGLLQVAGTSGDYTISSNVITFSFNLVAGDSVYVTYLKSKN